MTSLPHLVDNHVFEHVNIPNIVGYLYYLVFSSPLMVNHNKSPIYLVYLHLKDEDQHRSCSTST